jgi:hypothetical protein
MTPDTVYIAPQFLLMVSVSDGAENAVSLGNILTSADC